MKEIDSKKRCDLRQIHYFAPPLSPCYNFLSISFSADLRGTIIKQHHRQVVIFLLVCTFLLTGCGRIQREQSPGDLGYTLTMLIEPAPATVGASHLIFTLTDPADQPIDNATLAIEGNMTHAGMVPVLAQSSAGVGGQYSVPIEWTMSGDWLVTVQVTLADGQSFSQQFPVGVQ